MDDTTTGADQGVAAMLEGLVLHAAGVMGGELWDQPAKVAALYLGPDGDTGPDGRAGGLAWGCSTPVEVDGHPAHALVGVKVPDEAVGVVLVTEVWLDDTTVDGQRHEGRLALAVLRDGTSAQATMVRGGQWRTAAAEPGGHVLSVLRAVAGADSLAAPPPLGEVLARLWTWAALSVAGAFVDHAGRDTAAAAELEVLADLAGAGARPADAVVVSMSGEGLYLSSLPAPLAWLAGTGAQNWDDVLVRARESFPDGGVEWLLEAGDERYERGVHHWDRERQEAALGWFDAELLGTMFDRCVPAAGTVGARADELRATGVLGLGQGDLAALAQRVHPTR